MKYRFRRGLETVEDMLEAMGRKDIPSVEVSITREGDELEIDFGEHVLMPGDEEKLKAVLGTIGYGKLKEKG